MLRSVTAKAVIAATFVFGSLKGFSQEGPMKINHQYSPPWWQTLVCLPDDPVKTLVGREGQIFGDYGYKGPRHFSFSILNDSKTPATWKSQNLITALSPITRTVKDANGVQVEEETFLEIPAEQPLNSIVRYDSRWSLKGWSKPTVKADPAFNDVAQGLKGLSGEGLVEFHVRVKPGESFKAALGFCEGEKDSVGVRTMRINVEGSEQKDIDPVKDFGFRKPGVYFFEAKDTNNDGILTIVVTNKPGALNRNSFINGIWLFKGQMPSAESIVSGSASKSAVLYAKCATVPMPERRYHILVKLKNTTAGNATFNPVLRCKGVEEIKQQGGFVKVGDETVLSSSQNISSVKEDSVNKYTVALAPLTLKTGEQKSYTVTVSRFFGPEKAIAASVPVSQKQLATAAAWWKKNCPSATAISVPDNGIQDMVESCLRNIFQARDIRKGNKSFHVGPTEYRGLWLADGSYLLEVATMLNYTKDVRSCIDYLTHYQLPAGGFEMINTFHKENGLVLFMLTRHAMLTQDKTWLRNNWGVIEGCIKRINYLRDLAMKDPSKPYYTLLPDGNVDGGIQHGNDYSNTEYCLAGMKWAIWAAKWLGKTDDATKWQAEYDDFYGKFMAKARKDLRKDDKGNTYLPVLINNEQDQAPQKGQWAFCQSVYPGTMFDDDAEAKKMAEGTVSMLYDHRVEGLTVNTGWMEQGLWTYFSSFLGHDLLWFNRGKEVPQLLYDWGNHSSPTMVWREEQKPQGKGNQEVGDMPHNWASAEYIRLVVHMIELDRGKDLHLFEGLPKKWVAAGAATKLKGIRTPYGPIDLSLVVNANGSAAKLDLKFAEANNLPENVVINKNTWTKDGGEQTVKGAQTISMNIPINR
ncbi:hypothetical protein [Mucilaginibacter agri]|uniref:Alpha-L-rhamnosidase six-hairpin glycosidase domain-containing protein n=1 Tax=Mucilaginibacter agri TaxID=2695265 RepID=A0A966DXR7_9SPHI|nr:hypothetical protein [Mucilaginibacter agri]NCD72519.1 hypothetical protein [Mucilaginibacter agri]